MANEPLGISFSPFDQTQQAGGGPGQAPTPQSAIQVRNLRMPRTVGAASPIPGPLLSAPGGAGFGGSFGPAGMNLEQLLQLLFGANKNLPGGGTFNERPAQGMLPGPMGLPWEQPATMEPFGAAFGGKAPVPAVRPGFEEPRTNDQNLPGGTAGPEPTFGGPLPWEGDRMERRRV